MTSSDGANFPASNGEMLQRTIRRAAQLRRRRRAGLTAAAAALVALGVTVPLALAGGSNHSHGVRVTSRPTAVTMSPVTHPATSAVPTTVPVPPGPTTSAPTATTAPEAAACATSHLRASLANPGGAAGSIYYDLVLVNTGTAACSLRGYPGVSYVAGSTGVTVGAPATRNPSSPVVTLTLAPGQAARATLAEVDALNFPPNTCRLTNVNGLRIYPPNQTTALFVGQATQACANPADADLQIGPVRAASTPRS